MGRAEAASIRLNTAAADAALCLLNSGVREQEACKLEWDWEVQCAELGVSAFVVPAGRLVALGASLRNLDGNTPCKARRLERWSVPHAQVGSTRLPCSTPLKQGLA